MSYEREYAAFVAALPWVGSHLPHLDDVSEAAPLVWPTGAVRGIWVGEPPDSSFEQVGVADSLPTHGPMEKAFSGWEWIAGTISRVMGEPLAQQRAPNHSAGRRQQGATAFADWTGRIDAPLVRMARKIIRDLRKGLQQAEDAQSRKALVKQAIMEFNELNRKTNWITTLEREDICEAVCRAWSAAGGRRCEELIDEWREW